MASTEHLGIWTESTPLDVDTAASELVQVGNCGPPIELDAGWLVLTPRRRPPSHPYSLGALLLDLDDSAVVIGRTAQPFLTPQPDERKGYVPNVVYSCGALVHAGTLVLPYGVSDSAIRIATVPLDQLLQALTEPEA